MKMFKVIIRKRKIGKFPLVQAWQVASRKIFGRAKANGNFLFTLMKMKR